MYILITHWVPEDDAHVILASVILSTITKNYKFYKILDIYVLETQKAD